MSLDTVLQIGKVLRHSKNSLKYFKYIEPCPKDKNGNYPFCITIPVNEDFSLSLDKVKITPENERNELYYLKFKTSDSDGLVKYIYGDIFYERKSKINKKAEIESSEGGYYRLSAPNHPNAAYRSSSFVRGNSDFENIISEKGQPQLENMRNGLKKDIELIERIMKYAPAIEYYFHENINTPFRDYLKDDQSLYDISIKNNLKNCSKVVLNKLGIKELNSSDFINKKKIFDLINLSIFIHFDFGKVKHWYQFKNLIDIVSNKILENFVFKTNNGCVLTKSLYKNLCSGDKKNDIQFPGFLLRNKYKSKAFSNEDVTNLFYGIDYSSKGKQIGGTDIKLIILPKGGCLTEEDYENFAEKLNEKAIVINNSFDNTLFNFLSDSYSKQITVFDLIFCKKGGLTSPDKDLIEISNIEKSKLCNTKERISDIAFEIYKERALYIITNKSLLPFSIESSFRNILGNVQKENKTGKIKFVINPKYQSHLLKVLPQIYLDSYYNDDILLPSFVENVESSIRSGDDKDNKYKYLKFDLKFLFSIQNNKNNKYMEITKSESYGIGLLLGSLAKNLSMEINSFEKNYVGNLTRRISTLSDFINFKNDIEQKLIMHDKVKYTFQKSYDLAQKIKEFKSQYDKEECAFGFFESYFKPITKKEDKVNI